MLLTTAIRICFFVFILLFLLFLTVFVHHSFSTHSKSISHKARIARILLLTDLVLTTEARHTRHINFPELMSPFQDLPAYHDHFPSAVFLFSPVALPAKGAVIKYKKAN